MEEAKLGATLGAKLGTSLDGSEQAPVHSAATPVSPRDVSADRGAPIAAFGSMRFGKGSPKKEAALLKKELKKFNIDLFVAAPNPGADITEVVFNALKQSEIFIAFATKSCTFFGSPPAAAAQNECN